ncbi:hypothetical protein TorRG33x02_248610 [Trema orientale]|uniref:Uncharacterized protein n=1 Tax=Trema orientale TaxID=63057 RepID=A0A2P5DKI7_TREOI|nr:hypothetical protein TorRG33x02_248610 [Trema orientale]
MGTTVATTELWTIKITGYEHVPQHEEALLKAVSGQFVTVSIFVTHNFQMYKFCFFSGEECGMN